LYYLLEAYILTRLESGKKSLQSELISSSDVGITKQSTFVAISSSVSKINWYIVWFHSLSPNYSDSEVLSSILKIQLLNVNNFIFT